MIDRRRFVAMLALVPACAVPAGPGHAAEPAYLSYSRKLLSSLPAGARFRPDLEDYLDGLASAARRQNGRDGLTASPLLRDGARTQAVEMLKGDFVGHYSQAGYRFSQRFLAFAGDGHGAYGENVARDRGAGPVDKAKARRLFQQWLDSGGHRRNLMTRYYRFVSTGALQYGHHLYAAQIFWEK